MRIIVSSLLVFVLFLAFKCQDQENIEPNTDNRALLIGKWQLVEYYMSIGGPGYWTKADPAEPSIIEFKADGAYMIDCADCSGQYTVGTDEEIIIKILYDTGNVRQSELSGRILPTGELTIFPTNPMCTEGCSSKYKRIK